MATLTLQDGRKINFPDGLQTDQVKKIADAATAVGPASDGPWNDFKNSGAWQSDPIVGAKPAWESAPVVSGQNVWSLE